jgi:hypothetical protein
MAPQNRNQLVLLGALLVVLAATVYYVAWPAAVDGGPTAARERNTRRARPAETQVTAPEVHLDALAAERPKPNATERNLFQFKPPPPPPPPPSLPPRVTVTVPPPVLGPPPPPPLPPIPLKLAMVVSQANGQRIAFMSDTLGRQISGREGETIEGRYKVVRVMETSVDLTYLDGRGRQTIRLGQP